MKIDSPVFDFVPGSTPLLISMPHAGIDLPPGHRDRLSPEAEGLPDTDWHLRQLYDFAAELGAGVLAARYSRFAIDLNRPSDDKPLYATATTGLYPDILFDGTPAFKANALPDAVMKTAILDQIWRPYHAKIEEELARLKARHGFAVLFDAHSIRGEVPRLFDGALPDFNIGSNDGASADRKLVELIAIACDKPGYRHVVNGRFKGGHITRHYGQPGDGVHAIQLELAQRTYMNEAPPFEYRPATADKVKPILREIVGILANWRP